MQNPDFGQNMRKLPLAWFAIESMIILLAVSGCAIGGRQSLSANQTSTVIASVPAKTANLCSPANAPVNTDDSQESVVVVASENREQSSAQKVISPIPSNADAMVQPVAWYPNGGAEEWDAGVYISGGSTIHGFPAAIGTLGFVTLPTPWTTLRCGVMGADVDGIGVGGAEAGVRLHAPTRLTPYVGVSTELGFSGFHMGHLQNGVGTTTTPEVVTRLSGLAAVAPEAGMSYWLTPTTRINAGVSYFYAASQPDFLVYGMSMEFLFSNGPVFTPSGARPPGPPRRESTSSPVDIEADPYFVDFKGLADPMDLILNRAAERAGKNPDAPEELRDSGDEARKLDPGPSNPPQ